MNHWFHGTRSHTVPWPYATRSVKLTIASRPVRYHTTFDCPKYYEEGAKQIYGTATTWEDLDEPVQGEEEDREWWDVVSLVRQRGREEVERRTRTETLRIPFYFPKCM